MMSAEGEYIKQLRKERGWSSDELGQSANVSGTTIRLIESGKRGAGPKVRARIATALGTSVSELLTAGGIIELGEMDRSALHHAVQAMNLAELIQLRYDVDDELARYLGSLTDRQIRALILLDRKEVREGSIPSYRSQQVDLTYRISGLAARQGGCTSCIVGLSV